MSKCQIIMCTCENSLSNDYVVMLYSFRPLVIVLFESGIGQDFVSIRGMMECKMIG